MREPSQMWSRVEQIAAHAPSDHDLCLHRLQLVAARRLRAAGADVPARLRDAERLAAVTSLAAPVVLRRARDAYDGSMVLMKGPEIAARYPDPGLRPFGDLDLLVDDAPAAHRALLDAGFERAGPWSEFDCAAPWSHEVRLYHLWPLQWPGLPIGVEVHSAVHWPKGVPAPAAAELLACATPSLCAPGVVDTLPAAQHALVTAAHSWAHGPLACVGQLVDVALLAAEVDDHEIEALARRWGCERLWRTTRAAIDGLLLGARPSTAAVRLWARHLQVARERTLLEYHVEELSSPLWGLPARRSAGASARALARLVWPAGDETWRVRVTRARRAAVNARLPHSEHEARLHGFGRHGHLPPGDRRIGAPRLREMPTGEPGCRP